MSSKEEDEKDYLLVSFNRDEYESKILPRLSYDEKHVIWFEMNGDEKTNDRMRYVVWRVNDISTLTQNLEDLSKNLTEKKNVLKLHKSMVTERALFILRNLPDALKFSISAAMYVSVIESFCGSKCNIRRLLSAAADDAEESNNSTSTSSSFLNFSIWSSSNDIEDKLRRWMITHDERGWKWIEHVSKDVFQLPKHFLIALRKFPLRSIEFDGRTFIETIRDMKEFRIEEVLSALLVSIFVDGSYDARSSIAWRRIARLTIRDEKKRVRLEHTTEAQFLYLLKCGLQKHKNEQGSSENTTTTKKSSWKRTAMIGTGAVLGGVVRNLYFPS